MKKVIVTFAAIVALGASASASNLIVGDTIKNDSTKIFQSDFYAQATISPTDIQAAGPVNPNELPQVIKDALAKDYPGSTVKSASFDETAKTYTLQVLPKDAKETVQVEYNEKGEKVVKK